MPAGINNLKRSAVFIDLKTMDYGRALSLQAQTVQSKIKDQYIADHIFFVEHPCVFTLGKRGGKENLIVSNDFLTSKQIDIIRTDRGGNITYHGPGQAVLYPIVDLEKNKIGVKDFVHGLEEIMKLTALDFGVKADRDQRNHGLWVGDSKLGSVGISIKKGVSFHGLAMNIFPDLTPFSWINPCGLSNVTMTSIKKERSPYTQKKDPCESTNNFSMAIVKQKFLTHFSSIFNFTIVEKNKSKYNA
ncbi:MAG: lipoyl(octanoyl) transferase LipB [Desulfobacula sp.]|nr:lipoyl(octanoyl) transferase LipB [Desulfobacula sp.]